MKAMKHCFFISVLTFSALTNHALAGTMGPIIKSWSPVASIGAGPVWARGGKTQTIYLTSEIEKTYAARKATNTLTSGELFLGIQKSLFSQWLGQLGLAAATTSHAKLQGEIWDDANSQFNNHSYHYKVRNSRVAVKGKLFLDKSYWFMPWISASLGVGFNRAHSFTNTPLIFEALPNTNFAKRTKTAFTYTLGAGVQKAITPHWQTSAGYEFADWGKSKLGRAFDQNLDTGLTLNHLYTNGVLFNLTYIV